MCDPLELIDRYADVREDAVFTGDEVSRWPDKPRNQLEESGILKRTMNAGSVACDACGEDHLEEVIFAKSHDQALSRAYILCPDNGRVLVPEHRLYRWGFDFNRIVYLIGTALSFSGFGNPVVPNRIWYLGKLSIASTQKELFVARGLSWSDAEDVINAAQRLLTTLSPMVLVIGKLPSPEIWNGGPPIVLPLISLSSFEDSTLTIDHGYIEKSLGLQSKKKLNIMKNKFPTPLGAKWGDVIIRFVDGHTVSITVRDVSGIYHYTQMNMFNTRNNKPTVQWELLYIFAEGHGILDWNSPQANRKLKKRREKLADNLQNFFDIKGDSFRSIYNKKAWQARFSISLD